MEIKQSLYNTNRAKCYTAKLDDHCLNIKHSIRKYAQKIYNSIPHKL